MKETNQSGRTVTCRYDRMRRLTETETPLGQKTIYTYDRQGNLTGTITPLGHRTTYTYDEDGNLTHVERANGTEARLAYDGAGQVLSVSNYDRNGKRVSRYAYTYDPGGNILTEQITQEGETTTWEYGYNSRGELCQATATGARKETVTYAYDKAGNKIRITQSEEQAKETLRTVIENRYNAGNQLIESRNQLEGTTEYEYDADGNLVRELRPDEKILTYEYDTENRLQAVKENGRLLQAALYDGDDNRVFVANRKVVTEKNQKPASGGNAAGTAGSQELSEDEDSDGGDDDGDPADARKDPADAGTDGKETGRKGQAKDSYFWYGFLQNLSQGFALTDYAVSDALHRFWDGLVEWGHVPLLGDRTEALYLQALIPYGVSETERDTYELTYYINDINRTYAETLMEYDPEDRTPGSTYEYGVERLIYYDEEAEACYTYAYDGRGSVANLTGETGESVVSYMYDPYGNTETEGGITEEGTTHWNPYQYRGEYTDALTGNQYLRARYYRPSTGSFLTRDTYAGDQTEPVSLNRYTYAGNDPINLEDPSGHGWLKKKVQQAKEAVKKTASKAKKVVKSAAKKVTKAVTKAATKVVKKTKTVVNKAVKKAKTVVKKAKKTVKKVVKKAAKKVKSSKLYQKAKKTATKIKKKVCTTAKRIQKATVSFVKNVDWKKVGRTALSALEVVGSIAVGAVAVGTVVTLVGTGAAIVAGIGIAANAAYSGYINQKNGGNFFDGMFAGALNTSVSVFTSTVMGVNLPQNYIGDVGKMVINASVNYMAGTSSSLLLDTINGDKPDLNKALINGAEQGVIAGVLSISPENITGGVSPKGQGLSAFAGGLQQFWSDGRFSKSEQNVKKKN